MAASKPFNVLVVDGFATGAQYAERIRARGMVPYHVTSGTERNSSFSADFMEKYIESQIGGCPYEKRFRMAEEIEETARELKKYNFRAVIPGTETGVIAAETLAGYFGLPVNDPALLHARRDKYLMQNALKAAGLNHIYSLLTGDINEALDWYKKSGLKKIIIKPPKSAGTDGVRACDNEEEIRKYFEEYLNKTDKAGNFNGELLLQEYIYGDEMVVNCVSRAGKHVLTDVLVYNKILTSYGVPIYEASKLINKLEGPVLDAVNYIFKVLDALGISYGSSHSEVKLTERGPVLIETGARVMGSTPKIYYDALGYSLIDLSLDAYLSDAAHKKNAAKKYSPKKHFMAKFFISSQEADITEVSAEKTLPLLESFAGANFNTLKITKRLKKTVDIPSKPGECFLTADSERALIRDYNICRYLEICHDSLLWRRADKPANPAEEKLVLDSLKNKIYPEEKIERLLYGYNMAYKNFKNSVLYVLKDDLTPCLPGETGVIYVAGAYLAKKPYDMPCVKKENFLTNPFYTTVSDREFIYPFLYKTGEEAKAGEDGVLFFIDKKTGALTSSFGPACARETWPLTYTERQMVAEQQMAPDSNAYNAKFTFRLKGKLDERRLEEALKIWISRYRIFRSYYPAVNGKFVHKLAKSFPVEINKYVCTFNEALQLIEELNKPYDITQGPLYRFTLFKTGAGEHLFHINMHHIIADGTSLISIIEELWKLYKNKRAKKFRLEKEDFLDYAVWQSKNEDAETKKAFFLDLFKDGVPENEMPTRTSRPEILPHAADVSREALLDVAKIDAAAKRMGVSTALFMMTASSLTLAKYCGSEDIAVGSIMNGRSHPQTKELFGMFVNAVPLRFKPKSDMTLGDYMKESSKMFRGAVINQTCPFELLAPILAPQRNLSRKPVFDVIINYRGEIRPFETDGLKISSVQMRQATQIDLQFEIVRSISNINVSISYSKELYHEDVIEGMLELMEKIIDRMAKEGAALEKVSSITLLTRRQREAVLKDFAGKRAAYDFSKTFLDAFASNAKKRPAHPAVKFLENKLSYKELDALSGNLADLLIKKGLKKGERAAVLIKRGELMPVCALAVLKAGCAYVPLDASHPEERLEYILKDTGAKAIIADEELLKMVPGNKAVVTTTAEIRSLSKKECKADLSAFKPSAEDLFVILYTSGTTGRPKGVMLTHKNILGLCEGAKEYFNLSEKDNAATCAGFGFDACLSDVYPTLSAGGCVHVIPEDMRIDLPALNDYFEANKITLALLTTQLGRQFVTGIKNHSLRCLLVGGETLTPVHPPRGYKLYNAYGPTEATVYSSYWFVKKYYERVPLGKPVNNCSVYIVSKDGTLAPVGTFGELCISGANLAKGYLNLPELTRERFVKNPFSDEPGFELMYKTGDVARFTPHGWIDFLGRKDSQVKVRGFRIELGEIETVIRKYHSVRDTTVIAKTDKSGGAYVAAYITSDKKIDVNALKRFMEDALPPYMIPDFIMQIESIPLNPNGKVDKASLPDPLENVVKTEEYAAPKGRTERELALIWADILNMDVKTIGRDDGFFDLGGTSLRATELSLRVRDNFKENMPPATIFKFPKLKDQAAYLNSKNRFSMVYAFNENGKKTPIFFVHTANTGAEAYVPLAAKLPKDRPFYAVEPHNIFSEEEPVRGVKNLARRYIKYIQKVKPSGPYILGGWSFGAVVAYEMAVSLEKAGEKVENLYLLDPIIEHPEKEKELTRKLMETSFFQAYLNNDPLFGRFKKLGFMDKLIENNKNVLEDMFAYKPGKYGGKVTLFKAVRLEAVPGDVDKALALALRKFQIMHRDKPDNGFGKYVKRLKTVRINAVHNYLMRGNALEVIASEITGKSKKKK